VATYLAKQGRGTSNAVAATLFEISPDDYGLCPDAPVDEAQLAKLSAYCERMRAKPANDVARPARAPAAARAPAPAHDARTSFAAPYASAELARLVEGVALAHGFTPRKCEPVAEQRWLTGSYPTTTLRVYRVTLQR
jgi:hypothetical protein